MKKLLICLTVLFSIFLFNNQVSAEESIDSYTFNNRKYNLHSTGIENYISNVNYQTINQLFYDKYNHYLEDDEYMDSFFLYYSNDGSEKANLFFFNSSEIAVEGQTTSSVDLFLFYQVAYGNTYNKMSFSLTSSSDNTKYACFDNVDYDLNKFIYSTSSSSTSTLFDLHSTTQNSIEDVDIYYYTNAQISIRESTHIVGYTNSNAAHVPNLYNITFHLNGGKVFDSNEICNDKSCYILGNKYDDYTVNIGQNDLLKYLTNQEVSKETMQFVGWYYDEKLTKKVNGTDILDSDKHFYAKYQYKNVEDFLNNTNFNSYTFDENYQYAVISLNNQENRDIYLGLGIMSHNLEIYKYNKVNLNYEKGANLCLTPIFSKDNKYYYQVSDSLDNEYEVLVIPKEKLKGNYNFLLSNNAYVSYTNDLKNVVIKDENGNDLNTDLENSYNYSQDNLLNNENDLLEIFKDLINNKDNNVFSYFNQIWNYMKQNKLFIYFMSLIVGALIILIIKAASR